MNDYNIKFYDFLDLYNMLIYNFSKKDNYYQICLYYLDNKFNIEIKDKENNIICFKDNLEMTLQEYNYLTSLLGYEFISNHNIYLPSFDPIRKEDLRYYISKDNFKPIDYDKAKVHVLRNSKFELRLYYFEGLNKISFDMQQKALEKLNNPDSEKVYKTKK